jgi:hypothetical protein
LCTLFFYKDIWPKYVDENMQVQMKCQMLSLFTKMGLRNASQNDSPNNEEGLVEQTLTKWQAKAMLVLGWIAKQQQ